MNCILLNVPNAVILKLESLKFPSGIRKGNAVVNFSYLCNQRASALKQAAIDAPELAAQLLYCAQDWLTLGSLWEKFYPRQNQTNESPTIH